MKLSRRQFIALTVTAIGATVGGVALLDRVLNGENGLPDDTPGLVDVAVMDNLMALVNTYVDGYGSTAHYRAYFTWRAENVEGYRSIYTVFSRGLDEVSQAISGQTFVEANDETRQVILRYGLELPEVSSTLLNPTMSENPPRLENVTVDEALWLSFDQYVLGEMVTLFLRTNAWIMLGYDGYPAQARGLESYTQGVGQA